MEEVKKAFVPPTLKEEASLADVTLVSSGRGAVVPPVVTFTAAPQDIAT